MTCTDDIAAAIGALRRVDVVLRYSTSKRKRSPRSKPSPKSLRTVTAAALNRRTLADAITLTWIRAKLKDLP